MITAHLKLMLVTLDIIRDNLKQAYETSHEKLAAERISQAIDSLSIELDIRERMPATNKESGAV